MRITAPATPPASTTSNQPNVSLKQIEYSPSESYGPGGLLDIEMQMSPKLGKGDRGKVRDDILQALQAIGLNIDRHSATLGGNPSQQNTKILSISQNNPNPEQLKLLNNTGELTKVVNTVLENYS